MSYTNSNEVAAVAIVGLGPGGLAAALQAASMNIPVIAFTNRSGLTGYTRTQRIKISNATKEFLLQHQDLNSDLDQKFWKKYSVDATVQIKDLERYLYRKLIQYKNVAVIEVNPQQQFEVKKDDSNNNYIEISDPTTNAKPQQFAFKHLLGADGIKHTTANSVAKNFNLPIQYNDIDYQAKHQYHASVQLKVKKGCTIPNLKNDEEINTNEIRPNTNRVKYMLEVIKLGWNKPTTPKDYVWTNRALTKLSFCGEIPQSIYECSDPIKQKEDLKQWASLAIFEKYNIPAESLEFKDNINNPGKNKFHAATFEVHLQSTNQALINLHDNPEDGVFAQIGDARRTPYYRYGHGANDAVLAGKQFSASIDPNNTNSFNQDAFNNIIKHIDDQIENEMADFKQSIDIAKQILEYSIEKLITRLEKDSRFDDKTYIQDLTKIKNELPDLTQIYKLLHTIDSDIHDQIKQETEEEINEPLIHLQRDMLSSTLQYARTTIIEALQELKDGANLYSQFNPDIMPK